MPPRSGKSEFLSKWFPAWYLGCNPDHRVILASYGADFAAEWGAKVRDILEEFGPTFFGINVRPDRRAADSWGIIGRNGKPTEGGMYTCGVGGALTGRGANLLLMDDLVKNADEALSPTIRDRNWDWIASTASTRLEPGGSQCLTMTPWHPDDVGGRILERQAGQWSILRLPALAEEATDDEKREGKKGYDALMGLPDPIGRREGEALWPRRYPVAYYLQQKALDPFWFDALYQCRPRPRDGGFFKEAWFADRIIRSIPHAATRFVRYWDRAATQGAGDWTVGVLMSSDANKNYYIEHVRRGRWEAAERDRVMLDTAREDAEIHKHGLEIHVEQEPGSSGKESAAAIKKVLAGFDVRTETVSGNKESRARPLASACEAGFVRLCLDDERKYRHWDVSGFVDELAGFPRGKHDDQVDAASGAFAKLALNEGTSTAAVYTPGQDDDVHEYGMAGAVAW
jgi:predicted phage terminase large subunit-like protein